MKPFQISSAFRGFFFVALSLVLSCVVHGQSQTTSSIQGIAVDSSGAVITGVRVTVLCDCKECPNRPCRECCPAGFSVTVTVDDEGRFRIERVPAGVYRVRGEAPGFKAVDVHGVEVSGQNASTVTLKFEDGGTATAASSQAADEGRLEIKIFDRQTDKPLENATVRLLLQCDCKKECPSKPCTECCPSERQMLTTVTDASGIVTFAGPPGTYLIDTAFRAYTKANLITLAAGETEKLKVTLVVKEK